MPHRIRGNQAQREKGVWSAHEPSAGHPNARKGVGGSVTAETRHVGVSARRRKLGHVEVLGAHPNVGVLWVALEKAARRVVGAGVVRGVVPPGPLEEHGNAIASDELGAGANEQQLLQLLPCRHVVRALRPPFGELARVRNGAVRHAHFRYVACAMVVWLECFKLWRAQALEHTRRIWRDTAHNCNKQRADKTMRALVVHTACTHVNFKFRGKTQSCARSSRQ